MLDAAAGKKACILGAGTMGSGIAAHLANLGWDVTLLDLTMESTVGALDRAKALRPPHFYSPQVADRIRIGGIQTHLDWVAEADWVCEAIIEKLDAKRALYEQIEPLLREDAIISTNTSGLQIGLLTDGRSASFKSRFLGTHFFNPPRYLKLLELIPTQDTDPSEIDRVTQMLESKVGRRVVVAKDTPGFIANRYGMWSMLHAVHVAEKLHLTVEEVDAITGPFLGRPRSASFRLNDLVGLDIMADIAANQFERCPEDPFREGLKLPSTVRTLIEKGHLGSKSGAGYYRKEGRDLLALDLGTMAYREMRKVDFPSLTEFAKHPLGERIRSAMMSGDHVGEYLRQYLIPTLKYADYLKAEISHSVADFDRVMMWGFGWEMGPFAMIDAIGTAALGMKEKTYFEAGSMLKVDESGTELVPDEPEFRTVKDFEIAEKRATFNLRAMGDGVTAIEITTKAGSITADLCTELEEYLSGISTPHVICNSGKHFSVGFDLNYFLAACEAGDMAAVDSGLVKLQNLCDMISQRPVVAAVHGYCLGAGLEIAMACPLVVCHPEANLGLPEIRVGLLPGGSGTSRLRYRAQSTVKEVGEAMRTLITGAVSSNAEEGRKLHYLRSTDIVHTHPDSFLMEAKRASIGVSGGDLPNIETPEGPLVGIVDRTIDEVGQKPDWSGYDGVVAERIKFVLAHADSWQRALDLEREHFIVLCQNGLTKDRIQHMLNTGKPLRN